MHVEQRQTSFEKVRGSRTPQKRAIGQAKGGTVKCRFGCWSWTAADELVVSVREGTDVLVLACLSVKRVCCGPKEERGGKPRLEKLSAEQDRGDSGCPGALQTNRAPLDPATACTDLVH